MANGANLGGALLRLAWIMGCWYGRGYFTAMEYLERFPEIGIRTFRRDLGRLQEIGFIYDVPLGQGDGKNNRYSYIAFRAGAEAA